MSVFFSSHATDTRIIIVAIILMTRRNRYQKNATYRPTYVHVLLLSPRTNYIFFGLSHPSCVENTFVITHRL